MLFLILSEGQLCVSGLLFNSKLRSLMKFFFSQAASPIYNFLRTWLWQENTTINSSVWLLVKGFIFTTLDSSENHRTFYNIVAPSTQEGRSKPYVRVHSVLYALVSKPTLITNAVFYPTILKQCGEKLYRSWSRGSLC